MAQPKEVIDLVDSDDEECRQTYEDVHDDDVLVMTAVQPEHGGKKRKQVTNPYLKNSFRSTLKRTRTSLSDETILAGVPSQTSPLIVKIDNDGFDYGHALPGRLPPEHEWIFSNDTSKIVQFVGQKDSWSCGYRNLQMLLSAMLPHLPQDHLFHTKYPRRSGHISIPSLYQIQSAIENAWQEGFDPDGAAHFRQKLRGKRCFIGAVEVYSALAFWGIDATVVQFIRCRDSREQLPRFVKSYYSKSFASPACPFCSAKRHVALACSVTALASQLLTSASCDEVNPGNSRCQCPLMPLYFQWEGHSVTIVGVDDSKGEFIVFNPQHKKGPSRLQMSSLLAKDTQILMATSFRSISSSEQMLKKAIREFPTANLQAVMKTIKPVSRKSA